MTKNKICPYILHCLLSKSVPLSTAMPFSYIKMKANIVIYLFFNSFSRPSINFLCIFAFFLNERISVYSLSWPQTQQSSYLPPPLTAGILGMYTTPRNLIILTHTKYSFHGRLTSCHFDDRLWTGLELRVSTAGEIPYPLMLRGHLETSTGIFDCLHWLGAFCRRDLQCTEPCL